MFFNKTSGAVVLQTKSSRDPATALCYSPDGEQIGVGLKNGIFEFFTVGRFSDEELFTNPPRRAIDAHDGPISDAEFIEAEVVATCGEDGLIKVWDLAQTLNRPVPRNESKMFDIALSPDATLLACVGRGKLRLLDLSGAIVSQRPLDGEVGRAVWSPLGNRIAFRCAERASVTVRDRSGSLISTIAHKGVPRAVAFSPDEQILAAVGSEHLQLYQADDGRELLCRPLAAGGGVAVAFSPDGRYLAYDGGFGAIVIADGTGKSIQRELPCEGLTAALAFSPDGALVASGHADAIIRVWSAHSGKLKAEFSKHERAIYSLAFSADGRTLLSGGEDGTIRLWSIGQNRDYGIAYRAIPQEELHLSGSYWASTSLSSDGRWLAFSHKDHLYGPAMDLWDLHEPTNAADDAARR